MGSKIIVKGADFSRCAVAVTPNYEESLIGSSQTIWNNAASIATAGAYGAQVQENGYVSGIIIKSSADCSSKAMVQVYEDGSQDNPQIYDVLPKVFEAGVHEYTFTSPVPVAAGQVICIGGGSGTIFFYYASSGGDYPVSTFGGSVPVDNWRIYTINFVMQSEV